MTEEKFFMKYNNGLLFTEHELIDLYYGTSIGTYLGDFVEFYGMTRIVNKVIRVDRKEYAGRRTGYIAFRSEIVFTEEEGKPHTRVSYTRFSLQPCEFDLDKLEV